MANLPIGQVNVEFLMICAGIGFIIGILLHIAHAQGQQNGPPKKTHNPNVEDICHSAGKAVGSLRKKCRNDKDSKP